MATPHRPTAAVRTALHKLGNDLQNARKRRKLTMEIVADRAFTSRATLQKIERGDHSVGMGIYASVMHSLGLLDGLKNLADIAYDKTGQTMSAMELPKRVRLPRPPSYNKRSETAKAMTPKSAPVKRRTSVEGD